MSQSLQRFFFKHSTFRATDVFRKIHLNGLIFYQHQRENVHLHIWQLTNWCWACLISSWLGPLYMTSLIWSSCLSYIIELIQNANSVWSRMKCAFWYNHMWNLRRVYRWPKKGLGDEKSVHLKLEIEPGLHYFLFIIWDLEKSSKDMNQEAKLKQVISTHLRDKGQQAYEKPKSLRTVGGDSRCDGSC